MTSRPGNPRVVGVAGDVAVGVGERGTGPRTTRAAGSPGRPRAGASRRPEHEPGKDVEVITPTPGPEAEPELERRSRVVPAELVDLPEMRDRVDDERGQNRFGQALEQRGQARGR